MVLEQYQENKIDNEVELKKEIDWALKSLWAHENKLANDSIKSLTENQLATYIEKSFKNKENGAWDDYKTMKTNPFFGFMVQSSLDLLSDIFGDKKFNKDGKEASANSNSKDFKSLDEWLSIWWWIDNVLDTNTNTAVRIVQKILWLNVDGAAGPQFFAKVCSIFHWEEDVDANHFSVNWHENYAYNIDSSNSWNNNVNIVDNSAEMKLSENENYVIEHFPVTEIQNVDKAYFWIPRNRKVFKYNYSDEYCYVDWDLLKRFPVFTAENWNKNFLPRVESISINEMRVNHTSKWEYDYPNKCRHFQEQYDRLLNISFPSTEWKSIEYENWFYYIKSYNQKFKIDNRRDSNVWWAKWVSYIQLNFRLWDLCNLIKSKNLLWNKFEFKYESNNYVLYYWNPPKKFEPHEPQDLCWWFIEVDRKKFLDYLNNNMA